MVFCSIVILQSDSILTKIGLSIDKAGNSDQRLVFKYIGRSSQP